MSSAGKLYGIRCGKSAHLSVRMKKYTSYKGEGGSKALLGYILTGTENKRDKKESPIRRIMTTSGGFSIWECALMSMARCSAKFFSNAAASLVVFSLPFGVNLRFFLFSPVFSIQCSVLDGFGNMRDINSVGFIKIGDGSGDL